MGFPGPAGGYRVPGGAGLAVLAALTTAIYLLVALGFPLLTRRLPHSPTAGSVLQVRYVDGRGALRSLLEHATSRGFTIDQVAATPGERAEGDHGARLVEVTMHVHGRGSVHGLAAELSELDDVAGVSADDANAFEG